MSNISKEMEKGIKSEKTKESLAVFMILELLGLLLLRAKMLGIRLVVDNAF